jgi:hypothetical protein
MAYLLEIEFSTKSDIFDALRSARYYNKVKTIVYLTITYPDIALCVAAEDKNIVEMKRLIECGFAKDLTWALEFTRYGSAEEKLLMSYGGKRREIEDDGIADDGIADDGIADDGIADDGIADG